MRPWPRKMGTAFGRRFWQCSDGRQFANRRRAEDYEGHIARERARQRELAAAVAKLKTSGATMGAFMDKWTAGVRGVERAARDVGGNLAAAGAAAGPLAALDRSVERVCARGRGEAMHFPPLELPARRAQTDAAAPS